MRPPNVAASLEWIATSMLDDFRIPLSLDKFSDFRCMFPSHSITPVFTVSSLQLMLSKLASELLLVLAGDSFTTPLLLKALDWMFKSGPNAVRLPFTEMTSSEKTLFAMFESPKMPLSSLSWGPLHDMTESALISRHLVMTFIIPWFGLYFGEQLRSTTAPDRVQTEAVLPLIPSACNSPSTMKLVTWLTSMAFRFKLPSSTPKSWLTSSWASLSKNSTSHSLAMQKASQETFFPSWMKKCCSTTTWPNQLFSTPSRKTNRRSPLLIMFASLPCFNWPRSKARSRSLTIKLLFSKTSPVCNFPPVLVETMDVSKILTFLRTYNWSNLSKIALSKNKKSPLTRPLTFPQRHVHGLTTVIDPPTLKWIFFPCSCEQSWMSSFTMQEIEDDRMTPCLHLHVTSPPRITSFSLFSFSKSSFHSRHITLNSDAMLLPMTIPAGSTSSFTTYTKFDESSVLTACKSRQSLREELVFGRWVMSDKKPKSFCSEMKLLKPRWAVSCFESEHNMMLLHVNVR